MSNPTFESTIKAYLRAAHLTQAAAARRLGYAPDTFNKWVRGVNRMPDDVISQLGQLLKLPSAEVVNLLRLAGYTIPIEPAVSPTQLSTNGVAPTVAPPVPASINLPFDYIGYLQALHRRFGRWADLSAESGPLYPLAEQCFATEDVAQDTFLSLQALPLPMRVSEFRTQRKDEVQQPEELIAALLHSQRNVILGAPGSGKSSALERLAWLFADQALTRAYQQTTTPLPLPIFVRLADYHGEPDLIPLVRRSLMQTAKMTITDAQVRACLHEPSLAMILLLDGLNELDRDVQESGIKVVRLHLMDYPHHRVYLTCRIADFDAHLQTPRALPPDTRVWEIHPLLDEIERWEDTFGVSDVRTYLRTHLGEDLGRRLYIRLRRDERLQSLVRLPLFLWMIKESGGADGELPSDRGSLIRQFVRARRLLGNIPKPLRLPAEASLEAIGWTMHVQGVLELDERHCYAILDEVRGARSYGLDELWGWLQRSGLLLEPDHGAVRMLHQLVQEYGAAAYLARQAECEAQLITLGQEAWWREVVILALWLRRDLHQADYLQRLMYDPAVDLWVRAEAGAILAEVGDPRFPAQEFRFLNGQSAVKLIEPSLCLIPAGEALLGSDAADAFDTENPLCIVSIDALAIGQYPVTNAEYACFIAAGGYEEDAWWLPAGRAWLRGESEVEATTQAAFLGFYEQLTSGVEELMARWRLYGELIPEIDAKHYRWLASLSKDEYMKYRSQPFLSPRRLPAFWHERAYNLPNAPVVGVNWYEAMAYSTWLATITDKLYRLPTEAEWEWTAQRRQPGDLPRCYPWGDLWDVARCNNGESFFGRTCTVGLFPHGATPDGVHDLAGNVYEWTSTLFHVYPYIAADGRENPLAEGTRSSRGGAWPGGAQHNRCTVRSYVPPLFHNERMGFRLACGNHR